MKKLLDTKQQETAQRHGEYSEFASEVENILESVMVPIDTLRGMI